MAEVETTPCAFEFRSTSAAKVALAGNWNHWKPIPMEPIGAVHSGSWVLSVDLVPGEVQFKFVLDDVNWVTDEGYEAVDDGHGGVNNVREVALPQVKTAGDEEECASVEQKDENACAIM